MFANDRKNTSAGAYLEMQSLKGVYSSGGVESGQGAYSVICTAKEK